MSWTDESGNPECECGHLWSNHCHRYLWFGCEAPDCDCPGFSEITISDRVANSIFELEESEVVEHE